MILTRLLAPALVSALLVTGAPAAASTDVSPAGTPATTTGTVSTSSIPRGAIGPWKAARKVGRYKTVCGKVKSTKYARYSSGKPTFLDLGRAYPRQPFTIVIWRQDRWRYRQAPQKMFRGKTVCVRGRISKHNGRAQITARSNKVWRP
jgi:hypothetical protein